MIDLPIGPSDPPATPTSENVTREESPPQELEARFRQLVKKWRKETEHLSSTARMVKHPAYQEIIRFGQPVVPLLLAELGRRPDFWFAALREITGENPVPPESAGKVQDMASAWLSWGRAKGYLA
jgi:hypothetical protein